MPFALQLDFYFGFSEDFEEQSDDHLKLPSYYFQKDSISDFRKSQLNITFKIILALFSAGRHKGLKIQ